MNSKFLIDQLLKSGSEMLDHSGKRSKEQTGQHAHRNSNSDLSGLTNNLSSIISGKGGAALAGGALGLLIGNKAASEKNNQKKPLESLPPNEVETHCKVLLISLIAAAKADGHIDDRERNMIDGEIAKLV